MHLTAIMAAIAFNDPELTFFGIVFLIFALIHAGKPWYSNVNMKLWGDGCKTEESMECVVDRFLEARPLSQKCVHPGFDFD